MNYGEIARLVSAALTDGRWTEQQVLLAWKAAWVDIATERELEGTDPEFPQDFVERVGRLAARHYLREAP